MDIGKIKFGFSVVFYRPEIQMADKVADKLKKRIDIQ
jgi:hypothetical protein